uniref:Secreted protein n=1 Tax=Biomphalaria glabrata TaxID=6526 RepID=A0A2C9M3D8_BIOGL
MNAISIIVFAAAVIYAVSAINCPRCTDENDWTSCTDTQTCNGNDDTCQLVVENDGTRHRVNYHCTHSQNCQQHETQHCDITVHGHCTFCCDTIASCRNQREGIFDSLA